MRTNPWWIAAVLMVMAPGRADAQGARVFCVPNTQACFSATFGFVPTPANPFYRNRLSSVVTNVQGTYGGLNTPYGFLGLEYVQRWNGLTDERTTTAFMDLPGSLGNLRRNSAAPGFDFDQPTGRDGYMMMRGTGYLGCQRIATDDFWTWSTCPRDRRDGRVAFDMDLAYLAPNGSMQPATFRHFALRAHTTLGTCTLPMARWLTERRGDACEERVVFDATLADAVVTPEPGTLFLLGSGAALAGAALRRRRSRAS